MPPQKAENPNRAGGINFAWPTDEEGLPLALVGHQLSELIGLPNYSNVTVGPGVVMRFVNDTKEDRQQGLRDCIGDVEEILREEREAVLDVVRQSV